MREWPLTILVWNLKGKLAIWASNSEDVLLILPGGLWGPLSPYPSAWTPRGLSPCWEKSQWHVDASIKVQHVDLVCLCRMSLPPSVWDYLAIFLIKISSLGCSWMFSHSSTLVMLIDVFHWYVIVVVEFCTCQNWSKVSWCHMNLQLCMISKHSIPISNRSLILDFAFLLIWTYFRLSICIGWSWWLFWLSLLPMPHVSWAPVVWGVGVFGLCAAQQVDTW